MERIGVCLRWRKRAVELDVQLMEVLDLERNGNRAVEVFHNLWKTRRQKNSGLDPRSPELHSAAKLSFRVAPTIVRPSRYARVFS